MARQPFFSGNYGSALGQVDTRPIMQGAAAQAAAYQGLGQNIGGAIEKYQLNKQKADTADMMIGAYLQNMPEDKQLKLQNSNTDLGKSLKKLSEGELTTSKKIALAGALGVMQTQAKTAADIAESEARAKYYAQPRHAPPSPDEIAKADAIKKAMDLFSQPRQGGRGRRGAQAPSGAPGLPGPGTVDVSQLPAVPQQSPPLGGAYPPLPPQTGAVSQAMAAPPPPRRKRGGKYSNLSRAQRKLMRWSDQNPAAAAVLNKEVFDGGIEKLRDRSREWGRDEIGVAQEVLDKDGLATGTVLIATSPTTQLVQSASEVKPDLYAVQELEDGSSQQYMGNGKWVELVKDEFETKKDAENDAQRLASLGISAKTSFNKTTGRFNVEVTEGATRAFVEVKDPDFKGRMMYHPDTKQFWTMGKNGKMRPMVEDAVTVIGKDATGDDIVVLNGGSTPYIQNDKGLTQILPEDLSPEAHMSLLGTSFRTKSAYPGLKIYMEAQRQARADGNRGRWGGTGLDDLVNGQEEIGKTKYYYETDGGEVISVTKSKEMEDIIEEIKKVGGDMTALRLLHKLPTLPTP
tara:strand:+ start:2765 stop:4483 length:1719 start_codon:yes stop_codon:yes gene_type:complete